MSQKAEAGCACTEWEEVTYNNWWKRQVDLYYSNHLSAITAEQDGILYSSITDIVRGLSQSATRSEAELSISNDAVNPSSGSQQGEAGHYRRSGASLTRLQKGGGEQEAQRGKVLYFIQPRALGLVNYEGHCDCNSGCGCLRYTKLYAAALYCRGLRRPPRVYSRSCLPRHRWHVVHCWCKGRI